MIPCASLMQPSFLASLPSHGLTKTPSLDVDRAFSSWFCSAFCITHLRRLDATIRLRAIIARCDVFSVGHQLLNPIRLAHFYRAETETISWSILKVTENLRCNPYRASPH